jgi:hypothetical protein
MSCRYDRQAHFHRYPGRKQRDFVDAAGNPLLRSCAAHGAIDCAGLRRNMVRDVSIALPDVTRPPLPGKSEKRGPRRGGPVWQKLRP